MTHIIVNNTNFISTLNADSTIINFLDYLMTENINTAGHVITEVLINDQFIDVDNENEKLQQKIKDVNSIDIKTKSSLMLAFEAIESIPTYVDDINRQILVVIDLFRGDKSNDGNIRLAECIETIELFIHLFTGIQNTLIKNLPYKYIKSDRISKLELKLLEIVKELIEAKSCNDVSLLCDLLEYELADNLNQWKIQVVPLLLEEQAKL